MREFNKKVIDGVHTVSEDQLELFVKSLSNQSGEVAASLITVLRTLLDWPDSLAFPALDVARLVVLRSDANQQLCDDRLLAVVRRHIKANSLPANQMLTFRLLANMFCHNKGETWALQNKDELLKAVLDLPSLGSKNNQVK